MRGDIFICNEGDRISVHLQLTLPISRHGDSDGASDVLNDGFLYWVCTFELHILLQLLEDFFLLLIKTNLRLF